MSTITLHGHCHPRFLRVRDAFLHNFSHDLEVGASVAIYHRGELVVDLWAGLADRATGRPWNRDTMATVFSTTKGLVATAFLVLQARGELQLDTPVSRVWPAFAAHGKQHITIRQLLNHRAGLSAVDTPLTLSDWHDQGKVEAALVAQRPLWSPGTDQGYGATAWGMYTGALFRRLTGEEVGTWLRREVFEPLGADVWLGTPSSLNARIATQHAVPTEELAKVVLPKILRRNTTEGRVYGDVLFRHGSLSARALRNPDMGPARMEAVNDPMVRALQLPWMGAVGTARGVARVYAALAMGGSLDGVHLVPPQAIEPLKGIQSWNDDDRVLRRPMGFSQGFLKDTPQLLSPHPAVFGHTGAGGSVGLADPELQLSIGYTMNRMDHHIRSPRCIRLCRAMYETVGMPVRARDGIGTPVVTPA